jgi:hypothetical protein
MVQKITVTKFVADDGREFNSESEAVAWNNYLAKSALESDVSEVVNRFLTKHHFSTLSDSIAPYDGSKWWDDRNIRERERFATEVASFLVEAWDELKVIIDPKDKEKNDTLQRTLDFLTAPEVGTSRYMEGTGFWEDKELIVAELREALGIKESDGKTNHA